MRVVEGCEAEAEDAVMAGHPDLLRLGGIFRIVAVESRTLYLPVDEEVGDAQLQQRAGAGHQFLAVDEVIAIERAKEHVVFSHRDGGSLGEHCLVDTVEVGEGGEDVLLHVEGLDHLILLIFKLQVLKLN